MRSMLVTCLFLVSLLPQTMVAKELTVNLPGGVRMAFVEVPAGVFMMGSPEGERGNVFDNETQHQVTLTQGYYLGKTEVTQQQWQAVMGTPMPMSCGNIAVGDEFPVYCVNWNTIAGLGGFMENSTSTSGRRFSACQQRLSGSGRHALELPHAILTAMCSSAATSASPVQHTTITCGGAATCHPLARNRSARSCPTRLACMTCMEISGKSSMTATENLPASLRRTRPDPGVRVTSYSGEAAGKLISTARRRA